MAMQRLLFECTTTSPDYKALKTQLSSLKGVVSMDIDSRTGAVSVDFDDRTITSRKIAENLLDIGYQRV